MAREAGGLAGTALLGVAALAAAAALAVTVVSPGRSEAAAKAPTPLATGTCPRPAEPGAPRPTLTVVGDSTVGLAAYPNELAPRGAIDEALADGFDVDVSAHYGQTIAEALDEVAAAIDGPDGPPDAVVVMLGTNDAVRDTDDWPAAFDALIALVEDHPCTLLVTVNERTDAVNGRRGIAAGINTRIEEAAAAHPGVHRVDWNEDWADELGYTPGRPHYHTVHLGPADLPPDQRERYPDGMWVGDQVHQSPEGSVELVRRIGVVLKANAGSE